LKQLKKKSTLNLGDPGWKMQNYTFIGELRFYSINEMIYIIHSQV